MCTLNQYNNTHKLRVYKVSKHVIGGRRKFCLGQLPLPLPFVPPPMHVCTHCIYIYMSMYMHISMGRKTMMDLITII